MTATAAAVRSIVFLPGRILSPARLLSLISRKSWSTPVKSSPSQELLDSVVIRTSAKSNCDKVRSHFFSIPEESQKPMR